MRALAPRLGFATPANPQQPALDGETERRAAGLIAALGSISNPQRPEL
jgi:hypothetical protein